MIRHVVMWRLHEDDPDPRATGRAIKERLESMPPRNPEIKTLDVGLNFNPSPRSMDLVLCVEFRNKDALARYIAHPDHQEVVAFLRDVTADARVVDYEF